LADFQGYKRSCFLPAYKVQKFSRDTSEYWPSNRFTNLKLRTINSHPDSDFTINLWGCHIDSALLDYDIQEIKELAKVIGFEVESVVIQKREPDVKYFMGEGKVKELSAMVKDLGVDAVIFNEELSQGK